MEPRADRPTEKEVEQRGGGGSFVGVHGWVDEWGERGCVHGWGVDGGREEKRETAGTIVIVNTGG